MPVRTRVLDDARHRSRLVLVELGGEIRAARMASGLSLRDVAGAVRRSGAWVSRVERGLVGNVGMSDLLVLCAAVGLRLWTATYPAGRAVRDIAQLALLQRFRRRCDPRWRWSYEIVVPLPGDRRAADAVLRLERAVVMVEAITRLADLQAQVRSILLKSRDLGVERVVLVVAATHANRRALGLAGDVVASTFPLGTKDVMRALAEGTQPRANGIALL